MSKEKPSEETFILHKIKFGTSIKITYSTWNDRMGDQVKRTITEKENWHPDFSETVKAIVADYFKEHGMDIRETQVKRIRAKSLSLEGVKIQMDLAVMLHHELDEFTIKGIKTTGVQAQLLEDLIEESRQYVFESKRRQGDLFSGTDSFLNYELTMAEAS